MVAVLYGVTACSVNALEGDSRKKFRRFFPFRFRMPIICIITQFVWVGCGEGPPRCPAYGSNGFNGVMPEHDSKIPMRRSEVEARVQLLMWPLLVI